MPEAVTLILSKEDINNLLVFLKRANLSGDEALTYVVLRGKIEQSLLPTTVAPVGTSPLVEQA